MVWPLFLFSQVLSLLFLFCSSSANGPIAEEWDMGSNGDCLKKTLNVSLIGMVYGHQALKERSETENSMNLVLVLHLLLSLWKAIQIIHVKSDG